MTSSYTRLVPGKARRVRIYRNGDGHYKGLTVVLNYKQSQDINSLLDTISERIGLVLGVKRLFTTDGTQITSIEQLEHDGEYVASSGQFTPLAYGQSPATVNRLGQSGSLRRPRRDSASRSTQENNSLGSSYSRSIERSEKAASAPTKQRTKKIGSKKKVKEKAPPTPEPSPPVANNVERSDEEEEVHQNGEEVRSPEGTTEVEVIEHEQHDGEKEEEVEEEKEEEKAEEQKEGEEEEVHKEEETDPEEDEEGEKNVEEKEHEEGENVEEEEEKGEEKEESQKNTPKTPT
ncbi:Doublecortin domain-containing protein [Meloidogyne graminicola]|uniref:Doublecortin domain-containing protein n=1 Tax=Meloidogyne graminicola TaxID=189291 RepID=A0A8T0A1C0_9BILA|nr:Doublecortin domain-containing protein [Meloidogyne graminicola]